MSHIYLDGKVIHQRFTPKTHYFEYPFFMINIDLSTLKTLRNSVFSFEKFNLFSFRAKDHFGESQSFLDNVDHLVKRFGYDHYHNAQFVTLPRILNFVFNPISVLLLLDEKNTPFAMLAEVHNYEGGRTVYNVGLVQKKEGVYVGQVSKDMYVSPFFDYDGEYHFTLHYSEKQLKIDVRLFKENKEQIYTSFKGEMRTFSAKESLKLFGKHTFLTLWVVTRTLWQALRLRMKSLQRYEARDVDQFRRY